MAANAPPLNAAGREQAEALARRLDMRQVMAVYSSDLPRAVDRVIRRAQFAGHRDDGEVREVVLARPDQVSHANVLVVRLFGVQIEDVQIAKLVHVLRPPDSIGG